MIDSSTLLPCWPLPHLARRVGSVVKPNKYALWLMARHDLDVSLQEVLSTAKAKREGRDDRLCELKETGTKLTWKKKLPTQTNSQDNQLTGY